ncbi:MAG: DUF2089 family protein [Sedimenticolaceae bacterium]
MPDNRCPYCSGALRISKLTCEDCGLGLEGTFATPRLWRLEIGEQRFVELFVLASGSLKQTAELLEVSYPTVRSRLDKLIARLKEEQARDEERKRRILDDIEAGRILPKQGMRMIENL